jgi:hypothetical protein
MNSPSRFPVIIVSAVLLLADCFNIAALTLRYSRADEQIGTTLLCLDLFVSAKSVASLLSVVFVVLRRRAGFVAYCLVTVFGILSNYFVYDNAWEAVYRGASGAIVLAAALFLPRSSPPWREMR